MTKEKMTRLNITVPVDLHKEFKRVSEETEIPMSLVLRQAMKKFIKDKEMLR